MRGPGDTKRRRLAAYRSGWFRAMTQVGLVVAHLNATGQLTPLAARELMRALQAEPDAPNPERPRKPCPKPCPKPSPRSPWLAKPRRDE